MGLKDWWRRVWSSEPSEDPEGEEPQNAAEALASMAVAPAVSPKPQPPKEAKDPLVELRKMPVGNALEHAVSLLERDPDGRSASGVVQWLREAALDPQLPEQGRLRTADFFSSRGDFDLASRLLRPLAQLGDDRSLPALARLVELSQQRGDLEETLRVYEEILAIDLQYPGIRERLERLRAPAKAGGAGATLLSPEAAQLAGGRLELVRELGRGGAGAVFLARDRLLGREVALKIYHPAKRSDRGARLASEARVAAMLASRHVVRVFDLLEDLGALAMEYCPRGSLRSAAREAGTTPLQRVRWVRCVAHGLAITHQRGWVHRDLKPGNILLRADEVAVLTDFGLARRAGEAIEPLEGTPGYVAPEVRERLVADPRIDVYAFGALVREVAGTTVPALTELSTLCLTADPAQRPADGSALLEQMDRRGLR